MVNAKKVKEMVAKKSSQFAGSLSSNKVQPHKHCRICFQTIPLSSEPRVCKEQECIDKNAADDKNQRTVRIFMFIFFGLFAAPYLISLAMRLI
jgi:predicted nucleic acid-binding Zn ribbon protein|tara:strand:- start:8722 stop:9000 length:279 start_codon:yes stop_codon:yes gene_type:complete